MIKNILIPLDGSEHSKAALDYAVWLARGFDGMLMGQHVIDTVSLEGTFFHDVSGSLGFEPYLDLSTKMREIFDDRGKLVLENFREICAAKKIRVH
jgi:nucleotide-binding universal stress UspA family protein